MTSQEVKNIHQNESKLFFCNGRRLFISVRRIKLRPFYAPWDQLLISQQGYFRIQNEHGHSVKIKTCLIRSGMNVSPQLFDTSQAIFSILYLDRFSQDYIALARIMSPAPNGYVYHHPKEDEIITCLNGGLLAGMDANKAMINMIRFIPNVQSHANNDKMMIRASVDPRIQKVVAQIRQDYQENIELAEYAKQINVSLCYLEKLFKKQMGIPISRFRIRHRVAVAIQQMCNGKSITEAALSCGFSSTSHLSKNFVKMLGVTPSSLFGESISVRAIN